jgi:hypothetical protein
VRRLGPAILAALVTLLAAACLGTGAVEVRQPLRAALGGYSGLVIAASAEDPALGSRAIFAASEQIVDYLIERQ